MLIKNGVMQLLKIVFLYIVSLLLGAGLLSGCGGTDQNDDEILSITVPEGATSGDLKIGRAHV